MSKKHNKIKLDEFDEETLNELIADEAGAREPTSKSILKLLSLTAFLWAMFQLFVASSLPYVLGVGLFDDTEQRVIHLSFALFLGFFLYPAFKKSPRKYIPWYDWGLALLAICCTLYLVVFYEDISSRVGGVRSSADMFFSLAGIFVVLEITRRTIGLPLVIISGIFMLYALFGSYMPEIISHRGVSMNRLMEHLWLTTEGVFGLPLGVSASFIFLFVLFGALLEKAGAGNFFIQLSFSLLGHMRGGPAKAAVVSSGLTGLISGSAIANVATTGVFTIPLMKRIGFSAEKAAAIEVSASINGQIMPPVMGAAAFLMTEFVGISYFEVIKHAFLPAIISYIGLFYIVHLEAEKMNLPVLERVQQSTLLRKLFVMLTSVISIIVLSLAIYYGVNLIKSVFGEQTGIICAIILIVAYVSLLWVAAKYPEIMIDDPNAPLVHIPKTLPILMAGLYYAIPIGILIWGLMIERFSPSNAVIWAILALIIIMLTQHPILYYFRKLHNKNERSLKEIIIQGFLELYEGITTGSRNMVGIALAMGAAGIIVGVVSLTGVGLMVTEIIDTLSGGNVLIMLVLTAIMCVVLGMGLPTTANYIVVASVMAQPFVTLAAQHGLIVPLISINLFVFYFGLISGTTPPVAVDAYAGAAVAGAKPMQTAINSFFYNIRTSILPFIFIFNPGLLLIGMEHWWEYALVIVTSIVAMMVFCASTKGFFITNSYKWESALLLLIAFTLIRPGFWLDQISPPFKSIKPENIYQAIGNLPDGSHIRLSVNGENFSGDHVKKLALLPVGKKADNSEERLFQAAGLKFEKDGEQYIVTDLAMNSPAMKASIDYDWVIEEMKVPTKRSAKEWFYIPAFLLLFLIFFYQRKRRSQMNVA